LDDFGWDQSRSSLKENRGERLKKDLKLLKHLNTGYPGILSIPHLSVILLSKKMMVTHWETTTYFTLRISSPCLPGANFWSRSQLAHPQSKPDVWGELVQEKLYLRPDRHLHVLARKQNKRTTHKTTQDNAIGDVMYIYMYICVIAS